MKALRITVLFVLAAAAAGLFAVALASGRQTAAAGDCTTDPALDSEEQLFLQLINDYRMQNGRAPLAASLTLSKAAQWKSTDMGVNNYFAHDDLTRTWVERIRDCGYGYNTYLGENIAAGNSGALATFNQWKNSPGHNANMLGANYTTIGIGRANVPGSTYSWYWSNEFGGYNDGWPGGAPTPTRTNTSTPTRTPTRTSTPTPRATNTPQPTSTPTATLTPDTTPPTLGIVAPAQGTNVSGTVQFIAQATDGGGVQKVRFWVDGTYLGYDQVATFSRTWDTTAFANGRHTLKAQALDWAGNSTTRTLWVTVLNPDSVAPSITSTSPSSGQSVSGNATLSADVAEAGGMQKVRFWVDDVYLGYDSVAPFTRSWASTGVPNGAHSMRVEAIDWLGNTSEMTVPFSVSN